MKKSRLLEIIREEISSALSEITMVDKKTDTTEAGEIAKKEEKDLSTVQAAIKTAKTTGKPVAVAEEDLNEIPDFAGASGRFDKQVAAKYGEEDTLEAATEKVTNRVLSDKGITKADVAKMDAQELKALLKDIRAFISQKKQSPEVAAALEKQKEFDDSGSNLQDNQTNKAILRVLGFGSKKGPKGPTKSKEEKPASTGKKGRPAGEPKTKVATRTPGDDGFDDVSYSDDEDVAATKAAASDSTAKELASTPEEKKVKFNQFLASVKKNKDDKAKIDGILKLAKDKFKFAKSMMDDLKRAAGREVEA